MLRKLLLGSTAALGLATVLSLPAPALAGIFIGVRVPGPVYYPPAPVVVAEPAPVYTPVPVVVQTPAPVYVPPPAAPAAVYPQPLPGRLHVQYRACRRDPWIEYASFRHRGPAVDAENFLAHRGYQVRLVRY
jgi:hypothetical protein